mmetsp:Transcript_41033/g.53794  ORF Transcript_41033/g.53794 Transcript_41033/m.53794 type:complete len:100 (+) Transcript_41033:652-951(+)
MNVARCYHASVPDTAGLISVFCGQDAQGNALDSLEVLERTEVDGMSWKLVNCEKLPFTRLSPQGYLNDAKASFLLLLFAGSESEDNYVVRKGRSFNSDL